MPKTILKTTKLRLKPNKTQLSCFKKAAGVERWVWNYFLNLWEQEYQQKTPKEQKITKNYNTAKKHLTYLRTQKYPWISEDIGATVGAETVMSLFSTINKFYTGKTGKPKNKKKHSTKPGFTPSSQYLRVDAKNKKIYLQKIGWVRTSEHPKEAKSYHGARVRFDGKYWYLTYSTEVEVPTTKDYSPESPSRGIDKGLNDLIVDSNGYCSNNFNKKNDFQDEEIKKKSKEVKRLENKIKRLNRQLSRQEKSSKNRERTRVALRLVYRRLSNIRDDFYQQYSASVVKSKPERVVVEDLNIKAMLKNKYLAPSIHKASWSVLDRQLEYKCLFMGIPFVRADRFFPSTQLCFYCGYRKTGKEKLQIKDRTYSCSECGLVINRDLNSSLSLSLYPAAVGNSQKFRGELLIKLVESGNNRISELPSSIVDSREAALVEARTSEVINDYN